ncbi:MAG: nucleotidyltransferase domain-containing protein [Spirochaetaceae bacterium]|jgi:predicted nucleotidyltransferase|nr:nucleotidyltransferase domain-containing protein [Spirochaetaceae bacterium]
MVQNRKEAITAISEVLKNHSQPEICILYGSAASDRLGPHSDLDIAVASEQGLSNDFCMDLANQLSISCGREVSVLDLAKLEGLILREILSKGIQLRNENPNFLARFIIKMYDFVEDILRLQLEGIKKNLRRSLGG